MKLAIFENEYNNIKAIFDAFNLLHFDKSAIFDVFETSQDLSDFKILKDYDYILVDLDLSPKSKLDGYQIIETLLKTEDLIKKVRVLTGHVNPLELLTEKKLPKLPIIQKPLKLESLEEALLK